MFLSAVEEKEMYEIVNRFKNKTSTDWNDVDVVTVKSVIDDIVKPLMYVFNLSFLNGVFLNKLKVKKSLPFTNRK